MWRDDRRRRVDVVSAKLSWGGLDTSRDPQICVPTSSLDQNGCERILMPRIGSLIGSNNGGEETISARPPRVKVRLQQYPRKQLQKCEKTTVGRTTTSEQTTEARPNSNPGES